MFSTFGDRFLDQLIAGQAEIDKGGEIHWYHRYCIEAAGDIVGQHQRYLRGEFVWIPDRPNKAITAR